MPHARSQSGMIELPGTVSGLVPEQVTELVYLLTGALQDGLREKVVFQTLHAQLDISADQANLLRTLIKRCKASCYKHAKEAVPSLPVSVGNVAYVLHMAIALRVETLAVLLPSDASRFTHFCLARDTAASTVAALARSLVTPPPATAANDNSSPDGAHAARTAPAGKDVRAKKLAATIRGATRRIAETDHTLFDIDEHTEAMGRLREAANAFSSHCLEQKLGLGDVALQVVVELLHSVHDELSETGYIQQKEAMMQVIESELCPKLGVDRTLCLVLDAWVHLKQYLRHSDERMLRRARALLKEYSRLTGVLLGSDSATLSGRILSSRRRSGSPVARGTDSALHSANHATPSPGDYSVHSAPGNLTTPSGPSAAALTSTPSPLHTTSTGSLTDHLSTAPPAAAPTPPTPAPASAEPRLPDCEEYSQRVLAAMRTRLIGDANDAFARFSPEQLPHIVEIVVFSSEQGQMNRDALVSSVVKSSVDAAVKREWTAAEEAFLSGALAKEDFDNPPTSVTAAFLRRLPALVKQVTAYTRNLDAADCMSTSTRCLMLRQVHENAGRTFKQWLSTEADPLRTNVGTVRSAAAFELWLLAELARAGDEDNVKCWADAEALRPITTAWLNAETDTINTFAQRLCKQEDWNSPMTEADDPARRGAAQTPQAASAFELQRLFHAATSSFIELEVPIQGMLMRSLLELINSLAVEYARCVRAGCNSPEKLIRPPPPLTRYKKDLADKAAAGLTVKNRMKFLESQDTEHVAAVREYKSQLSKRQRLTVPNLLLRINSAIALRQQVQSVIHQTEITYARLLDRYDMSEQDHLGALEGTLDVALYRLEESIKAVQQYLANSAVFVSMSDAWYERVYMHHVRGSTLLEVGALNKLDEIMGAIMRDADPSVTAQTAACVAHAAFTAVRTVLLNGGEYRYFLPDDVAHIQEDLMALRGLFYADGHGVPKSELSKATEALNAILATMSLETGLLCENMDVLIRAKGTSGRGHTLQNGLDYETMLCILSHRADRIASKYLKTKLKMPKLDGKKRGLIY